MRASFGQSLLTDPFLPVLFPHVKRDLGFELDGGRCRGAGLPQGQRLEPEENPDGGHGAVRDVDRGTPEAESQWWADRLGDEWGRLAHPRFFPPMDATTAIRRFFAQDARGKAARRRGPALAGGGLLHFR